MKLRSGIILLCSLAFFLSLNSEAQTPKKVRTGEPDIYFLEGDDEDMNRAIATARETLDDFYEKFENNKKNKSIYFSIKVAFDTDDSSLEHIWLGSIQKKNRVWYGVVGNEPNAVSSISLGERVEIDEKRISDWMIIENNRLIGGYTIRAIRDRMSDAEKADFDRQFGVIIE